MSRIHRIIAFVLGVLFVLFALVQYNDPDPLLWMFFYGFAAVISYAAYYRLLFPKITIIALLCYLVGAIYHWPDKFEGIFFNMDYSIEIEEARESLGMFICAMAMGYFLYLARTHKSNLRELNQSKDLYFTTEQTT